MVYGEMKDQTVYCAVLQSGDTIIFEKDGKYWKNALYVNSTHEPDAQGQIQHRLQLTPICKYNYIEKIDAISHWHILTVYEPEPPVIEIYHNFVADWVRRLQATPGHAIKN